MEPKIFKEKIMMGITTYKYVTSIAFGHLMATLLDGVNTGLVKRLQIEADMYISEARNNMVREALRLFAQKEITHLLLIDDDMLLLPGTILKLVEANVPVVSGVYYTRDLRPVAYNFEPTFHFLKELPYTGTINVDGTGCGCLLLDCMLLDEMRQKYNDEYWFQSTVSKDINGMDRYLGEDVFFFKRLKAMGVPTVINCDIQCGHVGTAVVDSDVFKLRRKMDLAVE